MESQWKGYTILDERHRARAWKGKIDLSQPPKVDVTSGIESALSQAMRVIDVMEGFEEAMRTGKVVPI